MANTFIHGKLVTISIAGTYFAGLNISYDEVVSDLQDITFTRSGGATFRNSLPGYNFATGSIDFVYDTTNQPVLSPQNMIPGTLMTIVASPDGTKLYSFMAWSGAFSWGGGPTGGPVKCSTKYTTESTITRPSS